MDILMRDLRYSLRILFRRPAYSLAAIVVLALGIGATTSIFSVLYAVLWQSLPYRDADRLAIVWEADRFENQDQNVVNPANYSDWKEQNRVFEDMAAFLDNPGNITGGGEPEEVPAEFVTPNFFSVIGAVPLYGRIFTAGDPDSRLAVLSYGLWQRRFGSDPQIVGKKIILNDKETTIIGIMPPSFKWYIQKGSFIRKAPDIWVRWPIRPEMRTRQGRFLMTVARLKQGKSIEQAQAEMTRVAANLEKQYKDFNTNWGATVVPLRDQLSGEVRTALLILSGAVIFVLLIACTNVANLLLTRALSATKEIAVRSSLGATPFQIARQLLTESVLIAIIGGAVGLCLAFWGVDALGLLGSQYGIDFRDVHVNPPVVLFALGASIFTGLLFGMIPAWEASRWNVQEHLKETAKGATVKGTRYRNALIIAELSLAMVLLAGAALLIQSFAHLAAVNPGFNPDRVLTFRVVISERKYPEEAQRIAFFRRIIERLNSMPEVVSAGAISFLPFAGPPAGTGFYIEGRPKPVVGQEPVTEVFITDEKFFRTMQIPVLRGRVPNAIEATEAKRVVVINKALADKYFPHEDPIGKRLTIDMRDPNPPTTIIGVVGDVKHADLASEVRPGVYWPHPELAMSMMTITVRTRGNPVDFIPSVRQIVRSFDPDQPVADIKTMEDWLDGTTIHAKFNMILMAILAAVALILAAVGVYGVMSYTVLQRVQEIGVRMALGASSREVLRLILIQAGSPVVAGASVGLLAALGFTRLMQSMLFEVSPTEALPLVSVALFLVAVALLACWLPARRAAAVDPYVALRSE